MKTITFYSYKGGVGRSLALANIANRLSEFGKSVCMIDFDLEAPGLHIKFRDSLEKNSIGRGLVDYIYEFSKNDTVPDNILDFTTEVNTLSEERGKISLIAAGNTASQEYWKKLSHISWTKLFYEKNSAGIDFFYNLKLQIEQQIEPDFLLIDSRTGITDIAGVTMSIMADEVVLFAANNLENLDGVGQVLCSLANPENSLQNKIPKINVVLSRIPYFKDPKDKPRENNAKNAAIRMLNEKLENSGVDNYRVEELLVIHSEPEFEMQEEISIHHKDDRSFGQSTIPIKSDYFALFEELMKDDINESEVDLLANFKKATSLVDQAVTASNSDETINLLQEAISLYPRYELAYLLLGTAYMKSKDYDKAILNFDKVEELSAKMAESATNLKGVVLYLQGKFNEAIALLKGKLGKGDSQSIALRLLGKIYHIMKEYEESNLYFEKALTIEPDSSDILSEYASNLRTLNRLDEGFEAVYKALDIEPQHVTAIATLAELNAAAGNYREFYKNLDLAFSLGLSRKSFQETIDKDDFYEQFVFDEKFLSILEKYDIEVDWKI